MLFLVFMLFFVSRNINKNKTSIAFACGFAYPWMVVKNYRHLQQLLVCTGKYILIAFVHRELVIFKFFPIWQGHLYIIDVSQAVDLDHPHALDFLREDCVHVSVRGFLYLPAMPFPPSPPFLPKRLNIYLDHWEVILDKQYEFIVFAGFF